MSKPSQTSFTEEFEPVLVAAWGASGDRLSDAQLAQTRTAAVEIRRLYRFRDTPVNKIRFEVRKNAAGYQAAFGQRHAYLTYEQLKKLEGLSRESIPVPDAKGELTVTILGAGAAVEVYGLCLFYNEFSHRIKRLRLNLVDKVEEWKPIRQVVMGRLIKDKFPKLSVFPQDIDLDLSAEDSVQRLAFHHDKIVKTKILLIYNVLNEIKVENAERVWRNLKYILRQCEASVLVLVAEPNAPKARPRVKWLVDRLVECARIKMLEERATVSFDHDPVKIDFERDGNGLNDRLFSASPDGSNPTLQKEIQRTLVAAIVEPFSPVPSDLVQQQFRTLQLKRAKKGQFAQTNRNRDGLIGEPIFPGWEEPPLF